VPDTSPGITLPRGAKSRRLPTRDGTLHLVEAGAAEAPPTILLHGFPEFWWGWRRCIEPLAGAGLRVLIPDQRGYNLSSKPAGIASYHLDALSGDVLAIADAYQSQKVDLVGHDWGGMVACWVAMRRPDRVRKLVVVNAPHPVAAGRYGLRHPGQLLRSAYVGLFQLPFVPEVLLRRGDFLLLRKVMAATSAPGTFSDADLTQYREAWSRPAALTAMLNWYRAFPRSLKDQERGAVLAPTLILWGRQDAFLQAGLAEASLRYCQQGRIVWFDRSSHWIHHENAAAVVAAITEFLRE
jgi:pimeloyl-ACP methyl ester carboxylesterase